MIYAMSVVLLGNFIVPFVRKKNRQRILMFGLTIILIGYAYLILDLTILSRTEDPLVEICLAPFSAFYSLWNQPWFGSGEYIAAGILGNTVMFVPFGMYVANYFNVKQIRLVAGIGGFAASLCIECIQLLYRLGVFEVDDLICNTWGCIIGVCMIQALKELVSPKDIRGKKLVKILLPGVIFTVLIGTSCIGSFVLCYNVSAKMN